MGRFQKGPQLGSGFSGVVFRARDTITGDTVAIKEIHPDIPTPWRELSLARKISHINVCRVYDAYIEDGRTHIVMEFVDGETLRALMKRSVAMTVDQALQIIRQILSGLEAAHRLGVIHRDLKPNNIMITRDGTVKIMDFGLARTEDQPGPDVTMSDIGGTLGYIAPEQAIGHMPSPRADLYSVGVILYEMVSGDLPRRKTPTEVPGVPEFVESAILCCLEMDPARRPVSAAAFRDSLSGSRLYRPVPSYTVSLLACLVVVIGAWVVIAQMKMVEIPPPPTLAPAAVVEELPTVAIVFDGPVGRAFANAVVQGNRFRVVDRTRIEKLLAEIRKKKKDMDKDTAQQIGRVVGAKYFLFGTAGTFEDPRRIRIDAQLVETETTLVKISEGVGGEPRNAEKLATELASRFHL